MFYLFVFITTWQCFSARNARAAVNLLNPRDFGAQYSKNKMHNYISDEMYPSYQQYVSYIGSEDSIYPSSAFYSLNRQFGSSTKEKFSVCRKYILNTNCSV